MYWIPEANLTYHYHKNVAKNVVDRISFNAVRRPFDKIKKWLAFSNF